VKVTITPLDAATVAPPPRGRRYDSNAYRFDAVYAGSGVAAPLTKPADITLEYAVHATVVLQAQDRTWKTLKATVFSGSQVVVAPADQLGVFVASP
jgi:hypothetical protein